VDIFVMKTPTVSLMERKKLHLPENKTAKDRARNTCTCISPG